MRRACIAVLILLVAMSGVAIPHAQAAPAAPSLNVATAVSGLDHPWDIAFVPDGTMFFTERAGRLSVRRIDGTVHQLTADLSDLWASGETGLMGIESDPQFSSNRRIYTCQGKLPNSVQVVAWTIDAGYSTATRVNDPLVGGIQGTSGRHGGCSLRVDTSGFLQVGTGDAAAGTNPQDLNSLNGKTLRVNRFTGAGVSGNPFFGGGGDARIYTWGHRNVQGLALQPGTGQMWSIEHGPDRDDEVNRVIGGRNYGWDPIPGYNESVPMTDFVKFPNAMGAAWSSGVPTLATSGGAFLQGDGWGSWEGALAVAALKDSTLRVFTVNGNGTLTLASTPAALDHTYGRLRGAELGPGGALYLTTDNGGSTDQILVVTPTIADGPTVTSSAPNVIDYAARAYDGQTLVRSWNGSQWSAYTSIGGLTDASPDITSWGGGRLDVVVRGLDGAVYHQSRSGGNWSGWESLGGIATSEPTIVAWGTNRLDVFIRGADNALWHRAFAGSWQPWESLGGVLTSEPDVASWAPNRLDVFARGLDNGLWHRAWNGAGFEPWEGLGGILTSGPGVTSVAPGRIDIFVRGIDTQLWATSWTNQWTQWKPYGGVPTSSPDLSRRTASAFDLFTRGVDGGIYQLTVTSGVPSALSRVG